MASTLLNLRDSIVSYIKTNNADIPVVEKFPGRFDNAELDRYLTVTPAVYVAVISGMGGVGQKTVDHLSPDGLSTGQVLLDVVVNVFIATGAFRGKDADEFGLEIAENIAVAARLNSWGCTSAFPAHSMEIHNMWNQALDEKGMCIMGVAWMQPVAMGPNLSEIALQMTGQLVGTPTVTINDPTRPAGEGLQGVPDVFPPPEDGPGLIQSRPIVPWSKIVGNRGPHGDNT